MSACVRTRVPALGRPEVSAARGDGDLRAVRALFEDYARSLPMDLSYQDFAGEVAELPGRYAPPDGGLWLARDAGGRPVGCVGLRTLASGVGELKRLYLLPGARGHGLGRRLAEVAIGRAREAGYAELRLDTLPTMAAALDLYGALGFVRSEPYYSPTPPGTVFMTLRL